MDNDFLEPLSKRQDAGGGHDQGRCGNDNLTAVRLQKGDDAAQLSDVAGFWSVTGIIHKYKATTFQNRMQEAAVWEIIRS